MLIPIYSFNRAPGSIQGETFKRLDCIPISRLVSTGPRRVSAGRAGSEWSLALLSSLGPELVFVGRPGDSRRVRPGGDPPGRPNPIEVRTLYGHAIA